MDKLKKLEEILKNDKEYEFEISLLIDYLVEHYEKRNKNNEIEMIELLSKQKEEFLKEVFNQKWNEITK